MFNRYATPLHTGGTPLNEAEAATVGVAVGLENDFEKREKTNALSISEKVYKTPLAYALAQIVSIRTNTRWTTKSHTGGDVFVFAHGPQSHRFAGHYENTRIAQLVADIAGLDLKAASRAVAAVDVGACPYEDARC
jgi:alkaline phosphatase